MDAMPADPSRPTLLERLRDALPGWAGGVLTGLQGVALSYLLVLGPAFAAVAGAPSLDGSATVDWSGAAGVATRVWLLGLGVPIPVPGGLVSLVPLGLPLLMVAILVAVARRFAAKTWTSWALACLTFAAGAGVVASAAPLGDAATAPEVLQAATVAAALAAPAVAYGVFRQYGARLSLLDRVPDQLRAGLRLGLVSLMLIVGAAAVSGGVWALAGREEIAAGATALGMDPLGGIALALAEVLYVPTLVCWMVAYLVGPGFTVGTDTLISADAVTQGALPGVPLLGALPTEPGGWWVWGPLLVAALGFAARLLLARRIPVDWLSARTGGVALATVLLGLVAMGAASHGSLGPGRLADAGFEAMPVAALGTALVAAGYALAWAGQWAVESLRARMRPRRPVSGTMRTTGAVPTAPVRERAVREPAPRTAGTPTGG